MTNVLRGIIIITLKGQEPKIRKEVVKMKNRIAYNIVTGEVVEAYANKTAFHKMLANIKKADRKFYGCCGHWVFRNPWS